jgi:hypothetical protein
MVVLPVAGSSTGSPRAMRRRQLQDQKRRRKKRAKQDKQSVAAKFKK